MGELSELSKTMRGKTPNTDANGGFSQNSILGIVFWSVLEKVCGQGDQLYTNISLWIKNRDTSGHMRVIIITIIIFILNNRVLKESSNWKIFSERNLNLSCQNAIT